MKLKELFDQYPEAKRWRELITANGGKVPQGLGKEFASWACSEEGRLIMLQSEHCEGVAHKSVSELVGGNKRYRKAHWRSLVDDEPCKIGDVVGWHGGLGRLVTEDFWGLGLSRNQFRISKPLTIYRRKDPT